MRNSRERAGIELTEEQALDEITADYAGRLLVDRRAVERLSGENRGILQKMLDCLREFVRKVKAALGGENGQTAELEQAARLWEKALEAAAEAVRQNGTEQAGEGGARFSIGYDAGNRPFVTVEEDILEGVPREDWVRTVKDNLRKKFPNGVTVGNSQIQINAKSRTEIVSSRYSQYLRDYEPSVYADKLRSTDHADEILLASRDYIGEGLNHPRKDNIREFSRGTVQLRIGGNDYITEQYRDLRKELRTRGISIQPEYRADLESADGYENLRKRYFGKFRRVYDLTPQDRRRLLAITLSYLSRDSRSVLQRIRYAGFNLSAS